MRLTAEEILRRVDDVKNPRGLRGLREAIRKADPDIEIEFTTSNYGRSLWVTLRKGERSAGRLVQGERPYTDPDTGEKWWTGSDLLAVEEYDSPEDYDSMRARVVAQLVATVQPLESPPAAPGEEG